MRDPNKKDVYKKRKKKKNNKKKKKKKTIVKKSIKADLVIGIPHFLEMNYYFNFFGGIGKKCR